MLRKLLKFGAVGAMLTIAAQMVILQTPLIEKTIQYVPSQSRPDTALTSVAAIDATGDYSQYLQSWNDQHDVSFSVSPETTRNVHYRWDLLDQGGASEQIDYFKLLDHELSKYEDGKLKYFGLKKIVFVDNIAFHEGQPVLGFADVLSGTVYLNVEAHRVNEPLIQSAIHHEIAHIAFHEIYGDDMYTVSEWPVSDDANAHDHDVAKGYVNNYAESSIAEDMAEVYAYSMTDSLKGDLEAMVEQDVEISEKVSIVRSVTE